MKFLSISDKYVPAAGGAEHSFHEISKLIHNADHSILVVTLGRSKDKIENIPVHRIEKLNKETFLKIVKDYAPNVILTQLSWSRKVIAFCNENKIPVVFFSRVGDMNKNADRWVFNRKDSYKKWIGYSGVNDYSFLQLPIISTERFVLNYRPQNFITIINPVRAKGGELFRQIALNNPTWHFLAIIGWHDPLLDNIDLNLPNVLVLGHQTDMGAIYGASRVLLVPSIWEEPSPRVILEAAYCGVPVLASTSGGIPDLYPIRDFLIDPSDASKWEKKIKNLIEDNELYCKASARMKQYFEEYALKQKENSIIPFLEKATIRGNYIPNYKPSKVNMEWFRD